MKKDMKTNTLYIYGRNAVVSHLLEHPENVVRVFLSDAVASNKSDMEQLRNIAKQNRIAMATIGHKQITKYVGDVSHQGVIALIKKPPYQEFKPWIESLNTEEHHLVFILSHIQDTHNFGAIIRSAVAYGAKGIIIAKDHQAPLNATVFKTSAGQALKIPVIQVANINQAIEKMKNYKFWTACASMPKSRHDIVWNQDLNSSMAFVLGSEGKGVPQRTQEICDFKVGIPMKNNVESLNVAVASALVGYEWLRQQSQ